MTNLVSNLGAGTDQRWPAWSIAFGGGLLIAAGCRSNTWTGHAVAVLGGALLGWGAVRVYGESGPDGQTTR